MKKRRNRWIACCLFLSLLISLFPLSAFAQQSTADITTSETEPASPGFSEPDSIEEIQPTLPQTATEIPSRRERNVKHFDFGNGIYQAISYGSPVHRMDANGNWQDIDNRLLPDADNALQYATADGRIRVAKQSPMLILNENGYRIGMQPTSTVAIRMQNAEIQNHDELPQSLTRNATELGRVSNTTTVRYRDLYPSVDLEYILDGDDIKENIIVNAPTDRYTYLFDLALEGLVPELTDDGEILLRDAKTDDEMYRIPAPYMYDADGNTSQAVHYELAGQDGMYQLLVTADANWINAKDRAFPVTIDPTIRAQDFWDTHIAKPTPNGNYGTETALWISGSEIVFIRAQSFTIPSHAVITSAKLTIYYYYVDYVASGGLTAGAYQVMHSWSETGSQGLTWNIAKPDTTEYIGATCLDSAYLSGSNGAYLSSPKPVSFDITDAANAWKRNSGSNYGIALKYLSGTNSSVSLWSYEAGSTYRAYFTITYRESTISNKTYRIKNALTQKYLDVRGGGVATGTPIQQWTGNSSTRNQIFKITSLGMHGDDESNYYSIRAMTNSSKGLYAPLSGSNRNVTTLHMQTTDDWSIPYSLCWVIEKHGDYYRIRNGSASSDRYLTAPLQIDDGLEIVTGSYLAGRSDWILEECTETYNGAAISNFTSMLNVGETYHFDSYMYSSKIGVNGPTTYLVRNEDGTTTDKATIDATTGVITALKSGTIKVGVTYAGAPYIWYWKITIHESMEGTYFLRSGHYNKYMQVDNDEAPSYSRDGAVIEQWTFDGGNYQKWNIAYVSCGYYKILSAINGYAITVPPGDETNEDVCLVLKPDEGSANQLWRITQTTHGYYKIKAKSSEDYTSKDLVMRVNTKGLHTENGLNIMQMPYTDDTNYVDEWEMTKYHNIIQLEAQEQSSWCWAASARMSSYNYIVPSVSQASVAVYIKLGIETKTPTSNQITQANDGASINETKNAIEYILSSNNGYGRYEIYSEQNLRTLLDNGNPVIVLRGWYNSSKIRGGGHYTIIYDYYWDSTNGIYLYKIYDPLPENIGSAYDRSYQSICNGRNPAFASDITDTGVWEGIVVYKKSVYQDTISSPSP